MILPSRLALFSILVVIEAGKQDEPGDLLSRMFRMLSTSFGDLMAPRSPLLSPRSSPSPSCAPEGSWVTVARLLVCQCREGRVSGGCLSLASQTIGVTLGTAGGGGGQGRQPSQGGAIAKRPQTGIFGSQERPRLQAAILGSKGGATAQRPQAGILGKKVTSRRKTSGRGKAKLFRLFPEVLEPVIRTSNRTGCMLAGHWHRFPDTVSVSYSPTTPCRCTDSGMLWCFQYGVPRCLGCLVDGGVVGDRQGFVREGTGTSCTCRCDRRMEEGCLADSISGGQEEDSISGGLVVHQSLV